MLRRAFAEFLTLPSAVIAAFLLLALATYALDAAGVQALAPLRAFLQRHVFTDAQASAQLLGVIAAGLITITSITVSLLLVALQQAAAALTTAVFDQFLRRWLNQFYFGFFVGLTLYALLTLASVSENFNPVFGASTAFGLTAVALYLLIALLYTTINQMRPAEIIEEIHRLTLLARERQLHAIRRTRRCAESRAPCEVPVEATRHGYLTRIDVAAIGHAAQRADVEVVLLPSLGAFVAAHQPIARVRADTCELARSLEDTVRAALVLEHQRDIALDAAHGLEQLEMIGWTSISTAKSNPSGGLLAIHSLRDLLARWTAAQDAPRDAPAPLPVVYVDDTLARLMDTFETFAVVASESMQHQTLREVLHTIALLHARLPPEQQRRAEDIALRSLSALGDHVLTAGLDAALARLADTLDASSPRTAQALREAQRRLRLSLGRLNSRATRVPGGASA